MAQPLPQPVLDHLAGQIGSLLPLVYTPAPKDRERVRLAETFPVWVLDAAAVTRAETPLARLARQTGRWHHQIRVAGAAVAWARSIPLGAAADSWSVREVYEGALARWVDAAVEWLTGRVADGEDVRLLEVPAFLTYAFWVAGKGKERVVPIHAPAEFTRLEGHREFTAPEFLGILARERPITPEGNLTE